MAPTPPTQNRPASHASCETRPHHVVSEASKYGSISNTDISQHLRPEVVARRFFTGFVRGLKTPRKHRGAHDVRGTNRTESSTGTTTSQAPSISNADPSAGDPLQQCLRLTNTRLANAGAATALALHAVHVAAVSLPSVKPASTMLTGPTQPIEARDTSSPPVLEETIKIAKVPRIEENPESRHPCDNDPCILSLGQDIFSNERVTSKKGRKRASSAPPRTPSPENVKRSQIVEAATPDSRSDVFMDESIASFNEAEGNHREAELDALKAEHLGNKQLLEDEVQDLKAQIAAQRQNHEASLLVEQQKTLLYQKQKNIADDRAAKAEDQCKLADERLEFHESDSKALSVTAKEACSSTPSLVGSADIEHDVKAELAKVTGERDMFQDANKALCEEANQEIDELNKTIEKLRKQLRDYQGIHNKTLFDLETLRHDQPSAGKDQLLKLKENRYEELVRDYNQVIGEKCGLQQRLQDLGEQCQDQKTALGEQIIEHQANENLLARSRDMYKENHNLNVNRLLKKLTASEVDELTVNAWKVSQQDNKLLSDKVHQLSRQVHSLVKSRNDIRLNTNKQAQVYDRKCKVKNEQIEGLLRDKQELEGKLANLRHIEEFHVPGCHETIKDQEKQIRTLEKAFKKSDEVASQYKQIDALNEDVKRLQRQIENNQYMSDNYLAIEDGHHARAVWFEEAYQTLRDKRANGNEALLDPRTWLHTETCNLMRVQGKLSIKELEKEQHANAKARDIINDIWMRVRMYEVALDDPKGPAAMDDQLCDPDDKLEEGCRDGIKKRISNLFSYDVDKQATATWNELKEKRQKLKGFTDEDDGEEGENKDEDSETSEDETDGEEEGEEEAEEDKLPVTENLDEHAPSTFDDLYDVSGAED